MSFHWGPVLLGANFHVTMLIGKCTEACGGVHVCVWLSSNVPCV